jgi:hypothetical protein
MRLIAQVKPAIKSLIDWRTGPDGMVYPTYQECASAWGQLDDHDWKEVLQEAASFPGVTAESLITLFQYVAVRQSVCTPPMLLGDDEFDFWYKMRTQPVAALCRFLRDELPPEEIKVLILLDVRHAMEQQGQWSKWRQDAMGFNPLTIGWIRAKIPADFNPEYQDFLRDKHERIVAERQEGTCPTNTHYQQMSTPI